MGWRRGLMYDECCVLHVSLLIRLFKVLLTFCAVYVILKEKQLAVLSS